MKNISIIGVGQLGSRYLQGLAQVNHPLTIFLVDPSKTALNLAVDRFNSIEHKKSIKLILLQSLEELPDIIDIAIISTTADIRLKVILELAKKKIILNWILEKVLFQNIDDYEFAENFFDSQNSQQWVNCSQRLWPFFIELKDRFSKDHNLQITATGSYWGLGCNAVHNTDIAEFIWGPELSHIASLDKMVLNSKREGFFEFTGLFESHSKAGGVMRQISYAQGKAPFMFTITHPTTHMIWNVTTGKLLESSEITHWQWTEREMIAPFQSQITTQVINAILNEKDCGLPSFKASSSLHRNTLKALLDSAKINGSDFGNSCPVT
ncbi:MAG: hypothetical protein Q8R79_05210 [Legionellaceae bacterium]|nr:hypothetical protein [Legionellaceae bacterium]